MANKIGLDRLISGRPKKWQTKNYKNWSPGSPDLSPLDYYFWAIMKRKIRSKYNDRTLRTKAEAIHYIENVYPNEVDLEEQNRAIMGTLMPNGKYIGGYKSRLMAVLEVKGANLKVLTRKQRKELKCPSIEDLKKISINGNEYETDNETDSEPEDDA